MIDAKSWQWPEVFKWLQQAGNVETHEMLRTFNCGVGLIISVHEDDAEAALVSLRQSGEKAWIIGHVSEATDEEEQVEMI